MYMDFNMCLICIWPEYGSYKVSTVNSYNPHNYMGLTRDIYCTRLIFF